MTPGSTIRCGLVGAGIQQSLSPAMHEQEARSQGLHCEYKLIDLDALGMGVEALPRLIENARQENYTGLNITCPCKQAVGAFRLFTGRDADATRMQAHFRALVRSARGGGASG